MAGTAPPTRRWLLLEHPGPWRIDAIAGAGIAPEILSILLARAGADTRVLLVRRPGRIDRRAPRSWILAGLDIDTITGPWRHDNDLLDAAAALVGDSVGAGTIPAGRTRLHTRRTRRVLRAPWASGRRCSGVPMA